MLRAYVPMKKFLAESAIANLALIAFLFAYVFVERAYGPEGKYALVLIGCIAVGIYVYRYWRAGRGV